MSISIPTRTCPTCQVEVPKNCVRCRDCGHFLYSETAQFHEARQRWFVADQSNQQFGPFDTDQLRQAFNNRRFAPNVLVWRQGEQWIEAQQVPELFAQSSE